MFPASDDAESRLAGRVRDELRARGWTQGQLAERMKTAGVSVHQSAISKILVPPANEPRRKITVNELVAISEVFGISVSALLGQEPVNTYKRDRIRDLLNELNQII